MKSPLYLPDIEAEIYFLTTEEGGREHPVWSGYRPQVNYDGDYYSAVHKYISAVELVELGRTVITELSFLTPETHVGKLHVGKEFLVCEGVHIVGRGKITKILNLEDNAQERQQSENSN